MYKRELLKTMKTITKGMIKNFEEHLIEEEKSSATLEKYIRDINMFFRWVTGEIDKKVVVEFKDYLSKNYAPASVNSILSSLNSFFEFNELHGLKVKMVRIQKQIFTDKDKELTKSEYERLLLTAKEQKNERLYLIMQTICSTGIRVSELKFITVEAIKQEQALIKCKGKMRQILLPKKLCKILIKYAKGRGIKTGAVFVSKLGNPLDRSNIWSDMKKLCESAGVSKNKVFPHNLRHLFARTYYRILKDIVRLADILGHSNINTTRIYTMETGEIHRRQIQKLGLLRC